MIYRVLADLVVMLHFGFIIFAVFGALLVARWPWLIWLHIPSVIWAIIIEIYGGICPLTPLENRFRAMGNADGYEESFIEHYIGAMIYPASLTTGIQIILGLSVLVINLLFYAWLIRRRNYG